MSKDLLPYIKLASVHKDSSLRIRSLSVLSARNTKFLKTDTDFSLSVESIDCDSWMSCKRPPYWTNTVFRVAQLTTTLERAPRAAIYKKNNSLSCNLLNLL